MSAAHDSLLYAGVETVLAGEITDGDLKVGDQLPTEDSLIARFGVSRITVRRAIQNLVSRGLVEIRRGKGTFVAAPKIAQELAEEAIRRSEAYLAEAQRLSHTGSFGWKPDTGEIVWSDETYRIFEYDRSVEPTIDSVVQRVHPQGLRYCPVVLSPNGRVKPDLVIVNGQQERHPEGAYYLVPIPTKLAERLKSRKAKADKKCGLVFPTAGCNPKLDFLDCLKTVADRAKLDKENFWLHKFRATFATRCLWAGVDLRTVQQWLGHSDMESTMRYLKPSRSQQVRDKVNEIFV